MTSILLKGGRVIDPARRIDGLFDVLVSRGMIQALEAPEVIGVTADFQTIAAAGCWVVPGLIDPHVHLRDPGFPDEETIASGLRAAAAGGFAAVAAMANTAPVNDTPEITRYMVERAAQTHAARLVPVSAVTKRLLGRELVDHAAMVEAGARLFSDDGVPVDDRAVLARALEEISHLGFAVSLHEEDRTLSADGAVNEGEVAKRLGVAGVPAAAESRRVRRDLAIAIGTGAAVHVAHVSTAESLDLIRAARRSGGHVTCEVTPHHFSLDERAVLTWGPNAKTSPPLRCAADVTALEAALSDGTIDMIATDHAPHHRRSKEIERLAGFFGAGIDAERLPDEQASALTRAANGVIGLETALGLAMRLVHRSAITPARLVELMSVNPARLLRLPAGELAPRAVADVTVIDPNLSWTVDPAKFLSKSHNTPFAGMELRGKAVLTMVAGAIVYDGRSGESA